MQDKKYNLKKKNFAQNLIVSHLCGTIATFLTNLHRKSSNLLIDMEVLLLQKGTTQGGPESMPRYGIALLPLIKPLRPCYSVTPRPY